MDFIRTLFSVKGLLIAAYILIGVFANTASPHVPATPNDIKAIHSWVQYGISVLFWPMDMWKPTFTLGKWTP